MTAPRITLRESFDYRRFLAELRVGSTNQRMEASKGIIRGNIVSLMKPVAALDGASVAFGASLLGCQASDFTGTEGVTEANERAIGFKPGHEQDNCRP